MNSSCSRFLTKILRCQSGHIGRATVLVALSFAGCNQTSPVVEYSAAVQALDLDLKYERDILEALKSPDNDEKMKKGLQESLLRVQENIARLQIRIKTLGPRLLE